METKNVFEEVVNTLTSDARSLQEKFTRLQDKGDFRNAIDSMRLLKDTLSLIKEYDWKLMYSEDEFDGKKKVSIWEQNYCGKIRNKKTWNVNSSKESMYIDYVEKDGALVYVNGERYSVSCKPSAENGHIPLVDLVKMFEDKVDIYIDRHGFGMMISDILDNSHIQYKDIKYHNFINEYGNTYPMGNPWYKVFKIFLDTNKSNLYSDGNLYRGSGKSYALAKLCDEYDGLIIVNSSQAKTRMVGIKNNCDLFGFNTRIITYDEHYHRQYRDKKLFIDELSGLTKEQIDKLCESHVVVGFNS